MSQNNGPMTFCEHGWQGQQCNICFPAILKMTDEELKVEAALCSMIVSNPSGNPYPRGWKKRVNDLIRAQQLRIEHLTCERDSRD